MHAPSPARLPELIRRNPLFQHLRYILLAAPFGLAACGSLPPAPLAGADPADPSAPSRPAAYRSVTGGAREARPVEAGSWVEQNSRIAPGDKP